VPIPIFTAMRALLFLAFLCLAGSAFAARTDTVYLYNGDRITGEIKFLLDNKLSFKTDHLATLSIEWPSVRRICSNNYFDILTSSNERIFGRLLFAANPDSVIIELGSTSITKALADIVGIERVKSGFFRQISGTISLGVNYTNANENLQLNSSIELTQRSRKYQNNLSGNTVITNNANQNQTERSQLTYSLYRLYSSPWFIASAVSYQRNTELNMQARYQLFGGAGYFFVRKPGKDLSVTSGLSANQERSISEPASSTQNIEYVAAMRLHQFKFHEPQFDILTSIVTYTSLNTPGRFRFDFQVQLLWEIVNNFKWNISFFNNFDNKPPGGSEVLNDWNIITGLTYTL